MLRLGQAPLLAAHADQLLELLGQLLLVALQLDHQTPAGFQLVGGGQRIETRRQRLVALQ
ncbi:hypothetical protein D3C76_959610 [compost metagenome]